VLPSLKHQRNDFLLTELTKRWANHKIMNKWMRLFFMYLDRYYVKHHSLPTRGAARAFARARAPRRRPPPARGTQARRRGPQALQDAGV